ncbi:MAG: NfeD family protein [Oscillospiraceae bacterium]|nr:NfeD family protein [Oscillospiraceae bacterium]
MNLLLFWGALVVVFVVLEFLIVEFTGRVLSAIWFALGAAGALIVTAVAPEQFMLQLAVFLVISSVALYFTRPLSKRLSKVRPTQTNADRALAQIGVVRDAIHNLEGKGSVFVNGKLWSARSQDGSTIEPDVQVDILRIEGVKLIVRPHIPEAVTTSSDS